MKITMTACQRRTRGWTPRGEHSTGKVYVNFVADEGELRIADAYGARSLARLQAIKAKYDPGNLFRMNQNIRPAPPPR